MAKFTSPIQSSAIVLGVRKESIAAELGIALGYSLLRVNGASPRDLIDFRLAEAEETVRLEMTSPTGDLCIFEIEKEPHETLGITFAHDLFDGVRRCNNHCPFCFLNQMPEGLRETLYVHDDDYRLSFLHGNYITLTNLSDQEFERIIRLRLSPLHISVHATDPRVRNRMLGRRSGSAILPIIERLTANHIELHTQVVIWPNVNDGSHLDRTIQDLATFYPRVASLSVVPVGLTRHRDGLPRVDPVSPSHANELIQQINTHRDDLSRRLGVGFVYAADELYVLTRKPIPADAYYDGFPQLENGVGMLRRLEDELIQLSRRKPKRKLDPKRSRTGTPRQIVLVTGVAAAPWLQKLADVIKERLQIEAKVTVVRNRLFGESVTVAGLLCGRDITAALRGSPSDAIIFVPRACLDSEQRFLDDVTLAQMEAHLNTPIRAASGLQEVLDQLTHSR